MMKNLTRNHKILYIGFAIILISIMLLAVVFKSFSDEKDYNKYYSQAISCMENGDYETAISFFRRAFNVEKTQECIYAMSECYENLEDYDKAIEVLNDLEELGISAEAKIFALENKKKADSEARYITVGEEQYKDNITSLSLDNKVLGNTGVSQVAKLYSLSNLSLVGNDITDISAIASLGGLTTLNLSNNSIKDISALSGLTQLRTLYLDNNPIADLSPLYTLANLRSLSLKGLELSEEQINGIKNALPNCTIKGDISLTEESITIGGVTFAKSATQVDLSGLGIMDISALAECENLTSINISNNDITNIKALMDIPSIKYLNISNNAISDLRPLMGLGTIKSLDASNNNIVSTTSLGANTAIEDLNLSGNNITNFKGLSKLKNLANLKVANTGFKSSDIQYLKSSKFLTLDITGCEITGAEYEALQQSMPNCAITHDDVVYDFSVAGYIFPSDATEITISNCAITDLSGIEQFENLTKVIISWNSISDIGILATTKSIGSITYLDLSSNQIADVSALQGFVNLQYLNLSNNAITSASALYSLYNLRELYISGNMLTDNDIADLKINLPNCNVIAQ